MFGFVASNLLKFGELLYVRLVLFGGIVLKLCHQAKERLFSEQAVQRLFSRYLSLSFLLQLIDGTQ